MRKMETEVLIVGAGPSGLATSVCLNLLSIPNIILEREDCSASLWKKNSYDRVNLHLAKQFCQLPHMPYPSTTPTYIPKHQFIQYLDDYEAHFNLTPIYRRSVESASYEHAGGGDGVWHVAARNTLSNEIEEYTARFLVVATGENSDVFVPQVSGLDSFGGEIIHTSQYKSGRKYAGKDVLVVGSGNSGMEIALDLSNHGPRTSIVVRSPVHVVSREMVYLALLMLKWLPLHLVDSLLVILSKLKYGDLSKYGISRPAEGPYYLKEKYGKYPVIDVGAINKIKNREIQVLPSVTGIRDNYVEFANGEFNCFDVIIFATGYKRSTNCWLKDKDNILDEDGLPKPSYLNQWKGKRGLYCVGLSRKGLYGLSMDAENIANDIKNALSGSNELKEI